MGGHEGVAGGQPGAACHVLDGSAGVWRGTQARTSRVSSWQTIFLAALWQSPTCMCPAHSGAEGKIKAAAERASLAGVIAALAAAPGRGPSVARVAGQAVEFICKYYKVSVVPC